METREYIEAILSDLDRRGSAEFQLDGKPCCHDSSERCVGIPWALSHYRGEARALDVGTSLSDPLLTQSLLRLYDNGLYELHGLDIVPLERTLHRFKGFEEIVRRNLIFHCADPRRTRFQDNYFDIIFLISTLERIGFDQISDSPDTVFDPPFEKHADLPDARYHTADYQAIGELSRILRPNGSLLVTVPFGSGGIFAARDSEERSACFLQYSFRRWRDLLASSGLILAEERFFRHTVEDGWQETHDITIFSDRLQDEDMDQGVVCAKLVK